MGVSSMIVFTSVILLLLVSHGMFVYTDHCDCDNEPTSFLHSYQTREDSARTDIPAIFDAVENGITKANIKLFSGYFAKQVSLNLSSRKNAYYSANQSFYILQNYFDSRKVVSFKFSTLNTTDTSPYATGGGIVRTRGANDAFQVFVSLTNDGSRWVISQLNVY